MNRYRFTLLLTPMLLIAACGGDQESKAEKPVLVLEDSQPALSISEIGENTNAADEEAFEIKNDGFLIRAASEGNLQEVRELLAEGTDVNARNRRWVTPLIASSDSGHTDVVSLLLENGAVVDSRSFTMWPLLAAVRKDHADVADVLLQGGADTELTDRQGKTVLMHAIIKGNSDMIELLVAAGADVNAVSAEDDPTTPLVLAIDYGRLETFKLLLQAGAEPIHPADDRPLKHRALERKKQLDEIMQLLD